MRQTGKSKPVCVTLAGLSGVDTKSQIPSTRPAGAGWAALRQFRLSDIPLGGERWSSGVRGERWWRPPRRRARAGFKQCSAVQPRGRRQTGGIERTAFNTRVRLYSRRILVREARWAIRPTRWRRLGGASAISFKRYSPWGRTMELGRSGRTLVAAAAAPGARRI